MQTVPLRVTYAWKPYAWARLLAAACVSTPERATRVSQALSMCARPLPSARPASALIRTPFSAPIKGLAHMDIVIRQATEDAFNPLHWPTAMSAIPLRPQCSTHATRPPMAFVMVVRVLSIHPPCPVHARTRLDARTTCVSVRSVVSMCLTQESAQRSIRTCLTHACLSCALLATQVPTPALGV